jgi:hypothetical protein
LTLLDVELTLHPSSLFTPSTSTEFTYRGEARDGRIMPHKELVDAHGFTEVIATLLANSASGRLDVVAGGNEGALLFSGGLLVDARIGHLTGFQAINALASMRDARFYFDQSVAVPAIVSSITPSERLVLRQFFGIETAVAQNVPAPVVVEPAEAVSEPAETATIETAAVYSASPRFRYLLVGALAVLLIAVIAGAVLLREKFRERSSPASVASVEKPTEPISLPSGEQPNVDESARPVTPNLTGEWTVVNTVNTTSFRSFQNLRIGFALSINQTGSTFTAKGRKVSENGRSLPANSRTPIELNGVINGDHIEATFSEQSSQRKTNGRFVWKIDPAGGGLKGTFASSAARTSGKSTATREL